MIVNRHDPPPVDVPPPTFSITGLTVYEAKVLLKICQASTWIAGQVLRNHRHSGVLNDIYHALKKAGVPEDGTHE